MLGGGNSQPKTVNTLEEVLRPPSRPLNENIKPSHAEDVLPVPHEGMTLKELRDLSLRYKKIIEAGAYLALWTDLKATPVSSTDPETEARGLMSSEEEKLYDWFKHNGDLNEFDWKLARRKGFTPPGKETKFKQELLALRIMYKDDKLIDENLYYIREEKPAHFRVVTAYTKVIRAANNINQGITKGTSYDYKEYQTCNKLIGSSGEIVNEFMRVIKSYTRPIEETKELLMARRYDMAKRVGIKMERVGGAIRDARELGRQLPGKVTDPGSRPTGVKRIREDFATLESLRGMGVTKRTKVDELPQFKSVRLEGAPKGEQYRFDSPEYEPETMSGSVTDDSFTRVTNEQMKMYQDAFDAGRPDGQVAKAVSAFNLNTAEIKTLNGAHWRQTSTGSQVLAINGKMTNAVKVLVGAMNRLLRVDPRYGAVVDDAMANGQLQMLIINAHGFMDPRFDAERYYEGLFPKDQDMS
jgi:hypothetical protein